MLNRSFALGCRPAIGLGILAMFVACYATGPVVAQAQPARSSQTEVSDPSETESADTPAKPSLDLEPPGPGDFILDQAQLITEADAAKIRKLCDKLLAKKATPIIVVTIDSMAAHGGAGMQIDTFATLLFDQWGIGQEKLGDQPWNTGMLFLVSKADRKARITLGRYWKQDKNEAARQIMDQRIIPHFRDGDFSTGILEGVKGLTKFGRDLKPPSKPLPTLYPTAFLVADMALAQRQPDDGPPPLAPPRSGSPSPTQPETRPETPTRPRAEVSDPRDFESPGAPSAGSIDLPPPGERDFILDQAHLINEADAAKIREICDKLLTEKATPIIVVTIDSMAAHGGAGMRIETFARLLFDQWGIGQAKLGDQLWNTGMLLLVSEGDRKARIELGAHWRRDQDQQAQQIMNELIVPHFREGNYSAGILAGVEGLNNIARDLKLPTRPRPWWHYAAIVGFVALAIFTVISLIRRGSSGWAWLLWAAVFSIVGFLLWQMITNSGRSGGGGGYSGGSFGGGFSGGGGATGSW